MMKKKLFIKKLLLQVCFILTAFNISAQSGYSLQLPGGSSGSGSNIAIPALQTQITGYPYTVEMMVKPSAYSTYDGFWVSRTSAGGTPTGIQFDNNSDQRLRVDVEGSGRKVGLAGSTLTYNAWHHLALVVTATDVKVYVDGTPYTGSTPNVFSAVFGFTSYIGWDPATADRALAGEIDEFRIWNVERTAQELSDNKSTVLTGSETGLITYYNFDDQAAGSATDVSGHSNNGTITGGTYVDLSVSDDATLSNLTASVGSLSPNFSSSTFKYALKVPVGTTEVVLAGTKNFAGASVAGNGTIAISGDTAAEITVTAEAGNTQSYKVLIYEDFLFNDTFDMEPSFDLAATGNVSTASGTTNVSEVLGWTRNASGSYNVAGTYVYGTAKQLNGNNAPATDDDGASVGASFGIQSAYGGYVYYNQAITLPAGTFRISYKAYNAASSKTDTQSLVGFVPDSGTPTMSNFTSFPVGVWTADEIMVTLATETTGTIQIGVQDTAGSSGNNPRLFFDYFKIEEIVESIDASLSNLTTSVGVLSPVFDSGTYAYVLKVPAATASVDLIATTNDGGASVSGDGTISLSGDTIAEITVTAAAGNTETYKVAITENNVFNYTFDITPNFSVTDFDNIGTASGGTNALEVAGWTKNYTGNDVVAATFVYQTDQTMNGANAPYSDADGASVGASFGMQAANGSSVYYTQAVTLPAGNYRISYKAFNAHATGTNTNSLVGFVPDSGTAALSTLTSFPVGVWTSDEIIFTLATATTGVIQVGVQDTAGSSNNNPRLFFDNFNLETLVGSTDASLSALTSSVGVLSPAFDSATYDYTLTVPDATTSVNLNATPNDAGASVGNFDNFPVSGYTVAEIIVTAEAGNTQTYTVAITESVDASLSNLTTSVGTLSPAFDSATFTYVLKVPVATASVDLTATTNDAGASVSGDGTITLSGNGDDTVVEIVVTADAGNTETYMVVITQNYLVNQTFDIAPNFLVADTGNIATAGGGANVLEVLGWTRNYGSNSTVAATFEYGTAKTMNGATPPTTDADGASVGASLGIQPAYGNSVFYSQAVTLPAGSYKISYKTYNASASVTANTSLVGFVPDSGSPAMSTLVNFPIGVWTSDEITFTLAAETTGTIQVGVLAAGGGSGSNPRLFFDHFVLSQTTLGVNDFELTAFGYRPNPAKDFVNLNSKFDISEVSFYSIVGQHEMTVKNLGKKANLDISRLSTGIHFMKVQIQNQVKVIKLVVE